MSGFSEMRTSELAAKAGVSLPVVSRIHEKPVQRHKAALVITAINATPEVEGMCDFLPD